MKIDVRLRSLKVLIIVIFPFTFSLAFSQIFIAKFGSGTIGTYGLDGVPINPNLITGLGSGIYGLALDGEGHLYAASYFRGTVSKHTTAGALISASLIPGLVNPTGLAVDADGNLYVAESGSMFIAKYSSSGAPLNIPLIDRVGVSWGLAVDRQGGCLYEMNFAARSLGRFTLEGELLNFISDLKDPGGFAVDSGGNLYVGNFFLGIPGKGAVWKYSATGTQISTNLITDLGRIEALAFDENDNLYVVHRPNPGYNISTIGVYRTDGTAINASLISGLDNVRNVVVSSPKLPIPSLAIARLEPNIIQLSWPTNATGYLLESSANYPSGSWCPVLETPILHGNSFSLNLPITSSNSWYRLQK